MQSSNRSELYQRVTSQIIAGIEAGAGKFVMPWHSPEAPISRPRNVASKKAYRGINALILWAAAYELQAGGGIWGTFRQWQELGAQVRRGERSTTIVFWKDVGPIEKLAGEDAEERQQRRFVARGYGVFNASQVDGYAPDPTVGVGEDQRLAKAEKFFAALHIKTSYGHGSACYIPSLDQIQMPPFRAFKSAVGHYGVLFHEGVHATSAAHRCDRSLDGRFGSEAYAMEELCAEIGSALLLADLGIALEPRPDHAAYVASWLKVLRNDTSAIFTAASKAQAAVDWMISQQTEPVADG